MMSSLVETSSAVRSPLGSPQIVAVAVLYQRALAESETISSLLHILEADSALAARFRLIVYDNSATAQPLPQALPVQAEYVHDGTNGGLAPNDVARASAASRSWCIWMKRSLFPSR